MIVVMKTNANAEQIDAVARRIEELGLRAHRIVGVERTVLAAVGEERGGNIKEVLETEPGVDQVMPVVAPYKMASIETMKDRTVVEAGMFRVGGDTPISIVAGPCSVESEEQILTSARQARAAGATALRGGAFKPRTSPYSFQGLKEEGLKLLALARKETGLAVVTEVMTPHNVGLVAQYADVLQIGARNMQNYDLLLEVGAQPKPVLLKRGPSATVEEFLLAAEYILDRGNKNVILCERGIRTFENHTRYTLPLAIVPYLREKTHLPIMVDPSHGTGKTSLVTAMSKASIAAGADGLIVEVHPDPAKAWSDGSQTLGPAAFAKLVKECARVAAAVDRTMIVPG
ncbi:MAG: 3-deoxy-7-phosphoheptulonate synthase [Planctomycetia bacterium]